MTEQAKLREWALQHRFNVSRSDEIPRYVFAAYGQWLCSAPADEVELFDRKWKAEIHEPPLLEKISQAITLYEKQNPSIKITFSVQIVRDTSTKSIVLAEQNTEPDLAPSDSTRDEWKPPLLDVNVPDKQIDEPGPVSSDLTDDEWKLMQPFLSSHHWQTGTRLNDTRRYMNAIAYHLTHRGQWASLPSRYGNSLVIYKRFGRYRQKDGVFARALAALKDVPGADRVVKWLSMAVKPE